MASVTLPADVIATALKEQLTRNADTLTVVQTVISLSRVIVRCAPDAAVRAVGYDLRTRALQLSRVRHIPRFVVQDMIDEAIQRIESPQHQHSA